ncbi:hypothetical protein MLD38_009564 [Melastoma candidum]|uniref:Uncharacterized protein n=1 Tax=Melastoma candidum TaxID=119954 RepID=A0ACB9RZ90_9MYRT|nr:hypothetical protein MLD38_009564 [Melastoma candidum]
MERRSILMLPWLAHGHVSPYLQLSNRLAASGFLVYFCSTPACLEPVCDSLRRLSPSIVPVELDLPCSNFPELPPHYHTTRDLPPHLMSTLKTAFDASRPHFYHILESFRPNLVIYDFLQPWAAAVAAEARISSVVFLTTGGAASSFMSHCIERSSAEYPFPSLNMPESESGRILDFLGYVANGMTNGERYKACIEQSTEIVLVRTSRVIENKYVEHLSKIVGKEVVTVGPLLQDPGGRSETDEDRAIMDWLSKKEEASVVFVSFGTEYFLSKDEREEIAHGLEWSGVGFIWVVRFHVEERKYLASLDDALPKGFQIRVKDRGMVVENWAPQREILKSPSVGGFVSHCGWSSTLEAIEAGVPIVAMPMQLDQTMNARVVADIGAGVEVRNASEPERCRYEREEIARAVREIVTTGRGKEMRRKVKELGRTMKEEDEHEMESVVAKLNQLMRS